MPADLLTDAARLAGCGLGVAAAAVPAGVGLWWVGRRTAPAVRPWRTPWTGFDVVVLFLALNALAPLVADGLTRAGFFQHVYGPDFPTAADPGRGVEAAVGAAGPAAQHERLAETNTVRQLWAGTLALPLQLGVLRGLRLLTNPGWSARPAEPRTLPRRLAVGVFGWLAVTPVVFAVHFATTAAFTLLDWTPDAHSLTRVGPHRPTLDRVLFAVQACVAAPLVEELLFRGVLLGWLLNGTTRPLGLRQRPRVWVVLGTAVLVAATTGGRVGPLLFGVALLVGWLGVSRVVRHARTWGAVWASAALFAAVHSAVWPSPVPLFALGLGLGYLAVRTGGVAAPAVAHGLFNAVSVVYVLRGYSG